MACSKCRKKKIRRGRVITIASSSSAGEGGSGSVDDNLYLVQSRMYAAIEGMGLHFLPGERVTIAGKLLFSILVAAPDLFIFLLEGERLKFLSLHPSLQEVIG